MLKRLAYVSHGVGGKEPSLIGAEALWVFYSIIFYKYQCDLNSCQNHYFILLLVFKYHL